MKKKGENVDTKRKKKGKKKKEKRKKLAYPGSLSSERFACGVFLYPH
jgi:hypothetical protein